MELIVGLGTNIKKSKTRKEAKHEGMINSFINDYLEAKSYDFANE